MTGRAKKQLLMIAGTAIGIAFMWIALRQTDFDEIGAAFRRARLSYLPLIFVALVLFLWLKAARWMLILRPLAAIPTRRLFPVVVVGYASNILLPAQLGELVRSYIASRRFRIEPAPVLVTVVVERMFDFLAILVFIGLVLPFAANVPEVLVTAGYVCGAIGVVMLSLTGLHIARPQILTRLFVIVTSVVPARLRDPLNRHFGLATLGLQSLPDLGLLAGISGLSLLQWLLMGSCTWFAILALDIAVPVSAAFVVLAIVVVGMTIPSSPGFFGTIQLCFTIGLAPYGIDAGKAIAASLVFHVVMFVSVALGGAFFVRQLGYSASRLYHQSESAAVSVPAANYSDRGLND